MQHLKFDEVYYKISVNDKISEPGCSEFCTHNPVKGRGVFDVYSARSMARNDQGLHYTGRNAQCA
jgi:hypothetical protein